MLIFDDDITYLPGVRNHRCATPGRCCVLWQHNWSVAQLIDYARIHLPLLTLPDVATLCTKRQRERLSTAILTARLIGQCQRLEHTSSGRPYLTDSQATVSITHTGNVYGVSVAHGPHGIDAERWGPKALRLAEKFLQPGEQVLLDRLELTCEAAATALWSAKEAVYKACDRPGLELRTGITLCADATHGCLRATINAPEAPTLRVALHNYPDCVLTIADI